MLLWTITVLVMECMGIIHSTPPRIPLVGRLLHEMYGLMTRNSRCYLSSFLVYACTFLLYFYRNIINKVGCFTSYAYLSLFWALTRVTSQISLYAKISSPPTISCDVIFEKGSWLLFPLLFLVCFRFFVISHDDLRLHLKLLFSSILGFSIFHRLSDILPFPYAVTCSIN